MSAKARHLKAVADEARTSEGFRTGVNSQFDLDQATSAKGVAEAEIKAAEAAIEEAKSNLQYCRIYAPFNGRLSKRMVDEENLIKANDTLLTTIVMLEEVYATFDVDERTDMRVLRLIQKGEVTSSRETALVVQIALADDDDFSLTGTVVFTDNQIDAGTGTRRVRATIQNPRLRKAPWYLLSPGQFVRVRMPIGLRATRSLSPKRPSDPTRGSGSSTSSTTRTRWSGGTCAPVSNTGRCG